MSACPHCHRTIIRDADGAWVDPDATGDDAIWRHRLRRQRHIHRRTRARGGRHVSTTSTTIHFDVDDMPSMHSVCLHDERYGFARESVTIRLGDGDFLTLTGTPTQLAAVADATIEGVQANAERRAAIGHEAVLASLAAEAEIADAHYDFGAPI